MPNIDKVLNNTTRDQVDFMTYHTGYVPLNK